MAKLENRIRELEVELGNIQAHIGENFKGHQKSERRSKELAFQIEEVMTCETSIIPYIVFLPFFLFLCNFCNEKLCSLRTRRTRTG